MNKLAKDAHHHTPVPTIGQGSTHLTIAEIIRLCDEPAANAAKFQSVLSASPTQAPGQWLNHRTSGFRGFSHYNAELELMNLRR